LSKRLIDISPPLGPDIQIWPGDAPYEEKWTFRMSHECPVNVAEVGFSTHTGAHADGLLHFDETGSPIGKMPLESYIGPCLVVEASGDSGFVEVADLPAVFDHPPERLLIKTGARASGPWTDKFRSISPNLIEELAKSGGRLIGTDAPSLDPASSKTLDAHQVVRRHGLAILENLELGHVTPGPYELIAPPLSFSNLDASPVRAILREL